MPNHHTNPTDTHEIILAEKYQGREIPALHSQALDERGLEAFVDELMKQVRDVTPFSTSLQLDDWEPLDDEDKNFHIFHIVREAVSNALVHSGGTHIVVSLTGDDRDREVRICDDGAGVLGSDLVGVGFGRMARSARRLRGSIETARRPTGGTTVRLTFRH